MIIYNYSVCFVASVGDQKSNANNPIFCFLFQEFEPGYLFSFQIATHIFFNWLFSFCFQSRKVMQRNQHILQKSVCLKWIENSKSYSFFFQIKMMVNPWQVDSIEAFACLKCPECVFNTKENKVFQNHAVENHPMSHFLFGTPKSKSDTNIVVLNYDPNDIEKYIKENSNMLEYSLANSTEVSMIKEELSEKTYFVEQVNQINESSKSSFHGQPIKF